MRACIIFNPTAKGDKARWFRSHLKQIAAEVELRPTTAPGGARPLAAQAVQNGFDTLIAAGGDGTINEVINGLSDVPEGFARARLAVFPLGTANVFARELQLPFRLTEAWNIIRQGKEARVDAGLAEFSVNGAPRRRYFIQLGGAGLDARSIELLNYQHKRYLGSLAYVLAGFRAIVEKKPVIVANDGARDYHGELVLLGNGQLYGGPFRLFPRADPKDGQLDATIFPQANLRTLWRCCGDWLGGRWEGFGGATQIQFRRLTLRAADSANIPFELDGDNAGHLPVTIRVLPKLVRVVC
jgi:diacylglycerol kinase (ATP)